MKIAEMRELTVAELEQKIQESHQELFGARMKLSLQQLDNTAQLRLVKHRVAQLKTVIREKQQPQVSGGQKK